MTIAEFVWRRYRGYLGQTTSTRTILMVIEKRGLISLLRDPSQRLLTTSGEWCGSKTQRPLLWFVFINRALAILWCKNSHDFCGPWLGVKFFSPFAREQKILILPESTLLDVSLFVVVNSRISCPCLPTKGDIVAKFGICTSPIRPLFCPHPH